MTTRTAVSLLPIARCPKNSRSGPKPNFVFGIHGCLIASARNSALDVTGIPSIPRHLTGSPKIVPFRQVRSIRPAFSPGNSQSCSGTQTEPPDELWQPKTSLLPLKPPWRGTCPAYLPSTRKPGPAACSTCTAHGSNSVANGWPVACSSSSSTNLRAAQLSGNGSSEAIPAIIPSCRASRTSPRPASVRAGTPSG